jgi:hypothetical protein
VNLAECIFTSIGNIEKTIFVFVFSIDLTHCRTKKQTNRWQCSNNDRCLPRLWNRFIDEEKDRLFRCQLYSFTNDPHELRNSDIVGHEKFSFVYFRYLRFRYAFNNNLQCQTNETCRRARPQQCPIDIPEFVRDILSESFRLLVCVVLRTLRKTTMTIIHRSRFLPAGVSSLNRNFIVQW